MLGRVADCLVQMSRIFRRRKHQTQPTEWKRSSLGTTTVIQNIQQNQRRYSQSLQSHRTYQPYQRVVKAKQGALWMLQLSSMARECGSMSSGLFLWQRHLPSRFKPDRFHQAPSQASQGRFCSTSDVLRKMLPKCCVKCWILMDFVDVLLSSAQMDDQAKIIRGVRGRQVALSLNVGMRDIDHILTQIQGFPPHFVQKRLRV